MNFVLQGALPRVLKRLRVLRAQLQLMLLIAAPQNVCSVQVGNIRVVNLQRIASCAIQDLFHLEESIKLLVV